MTPEAVFAQAARITNPAARAAFLDRACAGKPDLRRQVEELLAAHAPTGDFAAPGEAVVVGPHSSGPWPGAAFAGQTAHHAPSDVAGAVLAGRYKLVEEIGEGGMGTVWMAQQTEPVKRLVAVKLIKPGMDSRAVLARFEAERQALAMMDHPHISKVLDAGMAPDGRPFFVMELVKGVPVTQFCDDRRLTLRERLQLFVPVCQAIQHAHQKGVIHRDIKPNNVLVALYDDRPVVKVIDFGVAKAAGQPLTDRTLVTGFGAVVGTPEYMSPEQASFNQLDVDTRSDIYSLGVLLYELLAGSPPFTRKELESSGQIEIFRVIREREPVRPSTRLSTASTLPTLAANRGTEPKKLTRLLRGELDWIVMKCLEKDRNRRYETANGLAADVQRYLSGEPVQAVPPSAGYRLRKFARKYRGPVVAAAGVFLALIAGIAGTTAGLISADRARRAAETAEASERAERGKAEAARQEADELRKRAERQGVLQAIDLLDQIEDERGLLQMARTAAAVPPHAADLRQYLVMRLVTEVQRRCPVAPDLEGPGPADGVGTLRVTPDGRHLVADVGGGDMGVWEVKTHRRVARLREGDEIVWNWQPSPDGKAVFTSGSDTVVRVWEVPSGRLLARTRRLVDPFSGSWAPESVHGTWLGPRYLATLTGPVAVQAGPGAPLVAGPDGPTPPTAPPDPGAFRLEVWEVPGGRRTAVLGGPGDPVGPAGAVAFSPDGALLVAASLDKGGVGGVVRVWRTGDGTPVKALRFEGQVSQVAFSPSGRRLVAVEADQVHWLRTDTWEPDGPNARCRTSGLQVRLFARDDAVILGNTPGFDTGLAPGDLLVAWGQPDPVDLPGAGQQWAVAGNRVLGGRWALDLDTRQVSPAALTQRYHPLSTAAAEDGRWLVLPGEIIDLSAQRSLSVAGNADRQRVAAQVDRPVRMPGGGYAWPLSEEQDRVVYVPPPTLDAPADVLELWVQVALRCELDPNGELVRLEEPAWERKRQELTARARPAADFPFPGRVAADRLYWLRAEVERLTLENASAFRLLPPLDRLIAAEPTAQRRLQRGNILQMFGRWHAAADEYLAARRLDPKKAQQDLNGFAWSWAESPGRTAEQYQAAARLAAAAREDEPQSYRVANTLGVAYYRVGRYSEALALLRESSARYRGEALGRQFVGPLLLSPWAAALADPAPADVPENPAFLAMVHARLGQADEARARLAELRAILADQRPPPPGPELGPGGANYRPEAWLREAEELIEGKPDGR